MKAFPLFTNSEARSLDAYAHEVLGYAPTTLMGMAAVSVFHANEDLWSTAEEIWIFVGSGGNGGDGYALANILHEEGFLVKVFFTSPSKREDSNFFASLCQNASVPILSISELLEEEAQVEPGTILLVDAILGTGFKDQLSKELIELIHWINSSSAFFYKLALDTATGFQASDKSAPYIEADSIEELGTRKWENIGFTVDEQIVPRYYESIGFPILSQNEAGTFSERYYFEKMDVEEILPLFKRKPTAHKYTAGSAIFFGGDSGMEGAIQISSNAFQNLGGGISKVFTPAESTRNLMIAHDTSRMVQVDGGESISEDPFFKKTNTIVAGPGLSQYPEFLKTLVLRPEQTLILDAGAIPKLGQPMPKTGSIILTPHGGEFERLTGHKCNAIQSAYEVGIQFCKEHKVNILYKSFVSMLLTSDDKCYIWESPNPVLATMGTGDLLVGILSRFISLGYMIPEAVYLTLSFLDSVREMPESYPSAGQMLQYLVAKV
jgi:hydroxyethylthiazole kinase-like uncharacterized protein yjeF